MDICLVNSNNKIHIFPSSVHGMLWLQTHFENSQWEALSSNQVVLSPTDSEFLLKDASQAGLTLNSFPSMAFSSK